MEIILGVAAGGLLIVSVIAWITAWTARIDNQDFIDRINKIDFLLKRGWTLFEYGYQEKRGYDDFTYKVFTCVLKEANGDGGPWKLDEAYEKQQFMDKVIKFKIPIDQIESGYQLGSFVNDN